MATNTHSIDNKNSLKLAQLLTETQATANEFCEKLNIKPQTFYKYIKAIKEAGLNVENFNNQFSIPKYNNDIKFADYEISVINHFLIMSINAFESKKIKTFSNVIKKIIRLSNKQDFEKIKENYLKSKKNIIENFQANNELLSKKQENKENFYQNEVIFELYERLAKTYVLKDYERVIDVDADKLVIASSTPDKNNLFKRLLRYDTLCKITFPKKERVNFKNLIEKTLDNLN